MTVGIIHNNICYNYRSLASVKYFTISCLKHWKINMYDVKYVKYLNSGRATFYSLKSNNFPKSLNVSQSSKSHNWVCSFYFN